MILLIRLETILCACAVVILFISGCNYEEAGGGAPENNGIFVEMVQDGKVYNNDPRSAVEDTYAGGEVDKMLSDVEEGDPYATALLGIVYYSDGNRYGISRDFDKGRDLLEKAWAMGVADAGYALFEVYGKGIGVEVNKDVALDYLQASAEMGYLKSQRELAKDYFSRGDFDFLETDYDLAREWYSRAAEQGDEVSAIALAKIYHDGLGVSANDERAFEWISRAENMKYGGGGLSIGALAQVYEEGIGTDIDLVQAYKYYDLRGTAGISDKQRLADQMSPEQIDQAVRLSGEWQREHNISMPNSEGYRYR